MFIPVIALLLCQSQSGESQEQEDLHSDDLLRATQNGHWPMFDPGSTYQVKGPINQGLSECLSMECCGFAVFQVIEDKSPVFYCLGEVRAKSFDDHEYCSTYSAYRHSHN